MPVTECIAVYIRLSSEDNDVDGSIKAESNRICRRWVQWYKL